MKVERALEIAGNYTGFPTSHLQGMAARALADEVKRLREQPRPRSMESAPRTGNVLVLARMTSKHTITFDALGWLPTSSGGEES